MIFEVLCITLIVYIVILVSILVFKKDSNPSANIITIPAPQEDNLSSDEVNFDNFDFDPLFKEICKYLLSYPEEPKKIVKFIREHLNEKERKDLYACLKYNNKKLYNTIISLQSCNLENISSFETPKIDIQADNFVTISEDQEISAQTGIPISYFFEQCEKLIEDSPQMEVYSLFAQIDKNFELLSDKDKEDVLILPLTTPKKSKGITKSMMNKATQIGKEISEEFYNELIKCQENNHDETE